MSIQYQHGFKFSQQVNTATRLSLKGISGLELNSLQSSQPGSNMVENPTNSLTQKGFIFFPTSTASADTTAATSSKTTPRPISFG